MITLVAPRAQLGFREVLAASYKDFVFDGQRVFSSIVGPEAILLMDRELT